MRGEQGDLGDTDFDLVVEHPVAFQGSDREFDYKLIGGQAGSFGGSFDQLSLIGRTRRVFITVFSIEFVTVSSGFQ